MRRIDHVEESIFISFLIIDLTHSGGHASQTLVVHQEIERLCVRQAHSVSVERGKNNDPAKIITYIYIYIYTHCTFTLYK